MAPANRSVDRYRIESDAWMFLPDPGLDFSDSGSPKEHPFVQNVRAGVVDYRFQSLSHFSLHIDVQPSEHVHSTEVELAHDFKMKILFQNYMREVHRTCRPNLRDGIPTGEVQVQEGRKWTSLQKSLERNFPVSDAIVNTETMRRWWDSNGKVFDWSGLPMELKEHVIQFCMCQPHGYADYFYSVQGYKHRHSHKPGPYEIVDQLGEWAALLGVSRQVRIIALRLCFNGSMLYPKGLSIVSHSHHEFKDTIFRLGGYYQMMEPNSVPNPYDFKTMALAKRYMRFPKIYPELKCHATFMHGIRKLYLRFSFRSCLHFFKVSVGGFNHYRHNSFMTCDVLERLPYLTGLFIALPTEKLKDKPMRFGVPSPDLFHEYHPCPRTLHRFIYERAAEELASYKDLRLDFFMDEYEEQRFWNHREAAVLALKFTKEELNELYKDCKGGVQLDLDSDIATEISNTDEVGIFSKRSMIDDDVAAIFPPLCECAIPCIEAFPLAGRY